jgi:hypothetical protein
MTKIFTTSMIDPELEDVWGTVESFYWSKEVNDILKKDVDSTLFNAAYDSIDWKSYYKSFKNTPFYEWAKKYGGYFISFGGPVHIEENSFFSVYGDISYTEEKWLRSNFQFNQVLHDIHAEIVKSMIDYIFQHVTKVNHHDL